MSMYISVHKSLVLWGASESGEEGESGGVNGSANSTGSGGANGSTNTTGLAAILSDSLKG